MTTSDSATATAPVAFVSNLPVIDITLADTTLGKVNSGSKDAKYKAAVSLADPSAASNALTGLSAEFKGRGNFTWTLEKRAYQIKFDKKTDVLGMGKAKAWVLLANHADPSMLRNKVAFDVADAVGLRDTSKSRYVDLRVDNTYIGTYQLTEKVEVGENRLELKDPNGVLVELDNNNYMEEPFRFQTPNSGTHFVLKDYKSDLNDDDTLSPAVKVGWDDIRSDINKLDGLLYASSPNWSEISKIIDVDSFVRYYYVAELTENGEIAMSSVYFYKDGVGDKLHIGPAWDYDVSMGNFSMVDRGSDPYTNYVKNVRWLRGKGTDWYAQLLRNPQFVRAVDASYDELAAPAYGAVVSGLKEQGNQIDASATKNFAKWSNVLGRTSVLPSNTRVISKT
ncbi:CotH kinase family protein, partial [Actinomyces polynesiensis]|uniref:CotH kinase family protein n=1 Tax=Actinomyces polynesiensis TaxID=1325934 RepID=UPI00164E028F